MKYELYLHSDHVEIILNLVQFEYFAHFNNFFPYKTTTSLCNAINLIMEWISIY